jgi:hypothetical protein
LRKAGFIFERNLERSGINVYPAYVEAWKEHIEDLKQFVMEFGHANVPACYAATTSLGKWCENQRGAHKRGELPQERIDELKEIGFEFEPPPSQQKYTSYAYNSQWDRRLKQLAEYKAEFGNCDVPTKYETDPQFGKWVENQKYAYKKGTLEKERVERLKELEFNFGRRKRCLSKKLMLNEITEKS